MDKFLQENCSKVTIDHQIPRIKMGSITYLDFFKNYIQSNKPCIIYGVTNDWNASTQWIDMKSNVLNFQLLENLYGNINVPVVDFDTADCVPCTKRTMLFRDYLKYWKDHFENKTSQISYLKDWHLRKERPDDKFYSVPEYFSSDWLNEYSTDKEIDDYMFVYMGPKGSWTPFHVDVFKSFSWSANVFGEKRWLLFPPGEEKKFMDSLGNLPANIENMLDDSKFYEIIQRSGEALFVPSGWYHQVFNTENTISVNHNWVNSCNINIVWNYLKENLDSVEKEIQEFSDSEGWTEHCQLMLQALFGMNVSDFINFVKHIAFKRLEYLEARNDPAFEKSTLDEDHMINDLNSVNNAFKIVISEIKSRNLDKIINLEELLEIVEKIEERVKN